MQQSAINPSGDFALGGRCIFETNQFLNEDEGVGLTSDAAYYGYFEVHAALVLSSGLHDKYMLHVAEEKEWTKDNPLDPEIEHPFSAAQAAEAVLIAASVDGLGLEIEARVDPELAAEIADQTHFDSRAVMLAEARNWQAGSPLQTIRWAAAEGPLSDEDYLLPLYRSGNFGFDPETASSETAREVFNQSYNPAWAAEIKMAEARNWSTGF